MYRILASRFIAVASTHSLTAVQQQQLVHTAAAKIDCPKCICLMLGSLFQERGCSERGGKRVEEERV